MIGVALLAGIGFTVSIFVANLSFGAGLLDEAKIGVLGASLLAGILGAAWLVFLDRGSADAPTASTLEPTASTMEDAR